VGPFFFHLEHKKNIICDSHYEVFCFYDAVKKGKIKLIYQFMLDHSNDEKTFYWIRDKMPILTPLDVAKRFFYLRKTCYRGMLRYNQSGKFNIPFGRYKKMDFTLLLNNKYEQLLKNTVIYNESFEFLFKKYNSENNFFFVDPPYDCTFNNYNGSVFDREKHKLLFDNFVSTRNKCLIVLNKTCFTQNLYKDYIVEEYAKTYQFRLHSSRVNPDKLNKHLVICNYTPC
jgi:DNA adenine methylase